MKLAKHDLVAALGLRYDHYSAQNLFEAACKNAGLADQSQYAAAEVAAWRAALKKLGDRLQRVDERLDSLLGEAANVPQAATPMPATVEPPVETKAEPANVPQAAAPMPPEEIVAPAAPAVTIEELPAKKPKAKVEEPAAPATSIEELAARKMAKATPTTKIVLAGLDVEAGEKIFICGDRPELGNWDPERARALTREGDAWSTSVEPGAGSFKFLRRSADGTITWEGGENRDIGTAVQIETSWQP